MIRAIMNGCHGVMGHVITDIISKDDAIEIVAGVDMNTENYAGYPVFKSSTNARRQMSSSIFPPQRRLTDCWTTARRRRFLWFYAPQDFPRTS